MRGSSDGSNTSRLSEINSMSLGQLVDEGIAEVYLIDKTDNLIPFTDDEDISKSRLVGQGKQGKVYAVVVIVRNGDTEEKRLCVLKELGKRRIRTRNENDSDSNSDSENVKMSFSYHTETPASHHAEITNTDPSSTDPNIIKFMTIITRMVDDNEEQRYALLPFCGLFLDDITRKLPEHSKENPMLTPLIVLHVTIDLLFALNSLHNRGFVHADIKGENIAYYLGHLCLIDLDCALRIGQAVSQFVGSPLFAHPACFSDSSFCAKPENDIYALGIVLKLLLQDQETIQWMYRWEIRAKEVGEWVLFKEISEVQTEKWKKCLFALKYNYASCLPTLSVGLSRWQSRQGKIKYIADRMTCIFPGDQPSVVELLFYCEIIKADLLNGYCKLGIQAEQEKMLQYFYDTLIPQQFFLKLGADVNTPLKKDRSKLSFFDEASSSRVRKSLENSATLLPLGSANLPSQIQSDNNMSASIVSANLT